MASLREVQERFAADLDREGAAATGVEVYRHAIAATCRRALGATYPVVRSLLGERFRGTVDAFVRREPPACGDLNVYGAGFADFLAQCAPPGAPPFLPDLARLEWALDECARATDARTAPGEVIAAISVVEDDAVGDLRMALHPSCRFVSCAYAVLGTWHEHQHGRGSDERVQPADRDGELLLARRIAERPSIERLDAGEFTWLRALQAGATFGEALAQALATDAAFDLGEALQARVFDGTIVAVAAGRYNPGHG